MTESKHERVEHEGKAENNQMDSKKGKAEKNQMDSKKGKSCKGCLYYSSTLKSNTRNPLCVGITRSLPHLQDAEASKEGRSLRDFKYSCVGYSVYSDMKGSSVNNVLKDTQTELPVCVGIEVLVDRKATTTDSAPAPAHSREEGKGFPQPRTQKPAYTMGDEFLSRFTRNASLVATGVAKNMVRVGNHIKESIDNVLYPYGRRPK